MQNYLLLARNGMGGIEEKVNVMCDLSFAKEVLVAMMSTKKGIIRGSIIEGNRNWIGDFTVKPIWEVTKDVADE